VADAQVELAVLEVALCFAGDLSSGLDGGEARRTGAGVESNRVGGLTLGQSVLRGIIFIYSLTGVSIFHKLKKYWRHM
jgi:hypothetical protein